MEVFDLNNAFDELFPPQEADLKNATETPSPVSLESILQLCRRKDRLGSMVSITIADGQSSMICAPPVQTYS